MRLQRLRTGEWTFGISGAVLLVSLFLPWWSLPGNWSGIGPGGPIEGAYFERGSSAVTDWSAWEVFSVADVLFALLGVLAIAIWALVARAPAPGPGLAGEALLTPLALATAVVAVVQLVGTPGSLDLPPPFPGPSIEYGAWLGLAASFGIVVGLLAAMRDERLSEPGHPTDQTGLPVPEPTPVETLPGPPPA